MGDDSPLLLPQGTLDLLILRTVAIEPQHGWAISQRIQQISSDVLRVQQGSLYPALHRLEQRDWIASEWGLSESNRRAKFYELTKSGKRALAETTRDWLRVSRAIGDVIGAEPEGA
jgi:PadR family transcriptional regulator